MNWTLHLIAYCTFLVFIAGCSSGGTSTAEGPNVVEVTARGLTLEAPDSISSGWTTFQLKNESDMTHFAVLERMPEGIGVVEQQEVVAPVFQEGMNLLNEGDVDSAMAAFGKLPPWFGEIVFMGGPGLIAPGRTAEATLYLEPGTYVLECYVKTNGVFHSYNPSPDGYGMVHEITVTADSSGAPAPTSTMDLTISSERGIEVGGDIEPGEHTIAVHFEDQVVHEHFIGHDVHLVRLQDDTAIEELAAWMDWTQPTGLQTPAPAEFVGGTNEMPAGETAYFTVDLEPGNYAWIAEVPDPVGKGMLVEFTVPAAGESAASESGD
jgi:hypothetical protein